jgi:hypothetical protein
MDIAWFLNERLAFLRVHFDICVSAFEERKRKIEAGEPPFNNPPIDEDGEPPFLQEWIDAQTSIELIGVACLSLLSDAFKLYLNLLQHDQLHFVFNDDEKRRLKSEGFVPAYRDALSEIFDTDWQASGIDFAVIEQVVLARNRGQHGTALTSFMLTHDDRTIAKHPRPLFLRADEARALDTAAVRMGGFLNPLLVVTRETLFAAIEEVEKLARWIDANMDRALRWQIEQRSLKSS